MEKLRKINRILFFIIASIAILYFGSSFLITLVFGIFFASLVSPVANLVERFKTPRFLSALTCSLVVFVVVGGLMYLLADQLSLFIADISQVRSDLQTYADELRTWIANASGITMQEQKQLWQEWSGRIIDQLEAAITGFLADLASSALNFLLLLVYVFLFIYYREKFTHFILLYTPE